jgi:phosphoribosylanthranilate isomerase
MTKIKVCGITNLKDLQDCIDLKVDYLGFNFFEKSPRYIDPKKFVQMMNLANFSEFKPKIVAVLVSSTRDFINQLLETNLIDILQFHGSEKPEFMLNFRSRTQIWKAFVIQNNLKTELQTKKTEKEIQEYENVCQNFLLDLPKKIDFSSGIGQFENLQTFNLLQKKYSLILAGGLNPKNILYYLDNLKPKIVDVASGIEKNSLQKDFQKLQKFVEIIRTQNKS